MTSFRTADPGRWSAGKGTDELWKDCQNRTIYDVCNWMIPAGAPASLCLACATNRTIPNLNISNHLQLWARMEAAKRRLLLSILRLGLPILNKSQDLKNGLAFDFLAKPHPKFAEGERLMTGHREGLITINLAEADDAIRERMRLDMREVYRTLLGHFRHEIGHYYWDRLVRDHPRIDEVRGVFGDERQNYAEALKRHYARKDRDRWPLGYVSSYAAAHPWEDWAETWAHVMHCMDTLETANAYGLTVYASRGETKTIHEPYESLFELVLGDWHTLTIVLNSLNRSMGLKDAYPFVISKIAGAKMIFVREWMKSSLASK